MDLETESLIPFPSPQIDMPVGEDLFQSPDISESEPEVAVPSPPSLPHDGNSQDSGGG